MQPYEWSEQAFSERLVEAAGCHDFHACRALLDSFERHLATRADPYPAASARADLAALRRTRQLMRMRGYADAVLTSMDDPQVRRQLGQALIELKEFDRAIRVLTTLESETRSSEDADVRNEHAEACGLLGRAWKQQYVN